MTSTRCPFAQPPLHERISHIIQQRSTNRDDIREVALNGLELSQVEAVLDLGCGFGFMASALGPRISASGRIIGVDGCEENRDPFLKQVERSARQGEFMALTLSDTLPWEAEQFDIVVASYSLYFFPKILPEIARVLRSDGMLLTITHSRRSFRGLLEACGLDSTRAPLVDLIERFSVETGPTQLQTVFREIETLHYPNALRFGADHLDDLLAYARFKVPFMVSERAASEGERQTASIEEHLTRSLACSRRVVVEKDDGVFRCWRPIRTRRSERVVHEG